MTGVWEERAAQNEALFRQVNEQVETLSHRFGSDTGAETTAFVCECSNETCFAHIRLPHDIYEDVRANPRRFVVVPGHEQPTIERVVERGPGYLIVEKQGTAGRIAAQTDPRGSDSSPA